MKTRGREEARRRRQEQALSIKQIERLLGVARPSVSPWVRDIELTLGQRQALRLRMGASGQRGNAVVSVRWRALRKRAQAEGRVHHAAVIFPRCRVHALLGRKGASIGTPLAFSNSDPEVLRFFVA